MRKARLVAELVMAGWTMCLALYVGLGGGNGYAFILDWPVRTATITRVIALWVAGIVPCLLVRWWTRGS